MEPLSSNKDRSSINSKANNSENNNSQKVTKLVTLGNIDFTFSLKLNKLYFEEQNISFESIEKESDLIFLANDKEIWEDISLSSDCNIINFALQLNRATKEKIFVSFVLLAKIEYKKDLQFMKDIVTFVTERNWIFLNYGDLLNDIQQSITFNIYCDDQIKSFEILQNGNKSKKIKKPNDKNRKKEEDDEEENENENEKENTEPIIKVSNEQNKSQNNINNTNKDIKKSENDSTKNKNEDNNNKNSTNNNNEQKIENNKINNNNEQKIENNKINNSSLENNQDNENNNKEDLLNNLKDSFFFNFDFVYLDMSLFGDRAILQNISFENLDNFIRKLKENFDIQIIVYYSNILSNIDTSNDVSNFQNILYLTDYYLFEKRDAYLIFNFLHIIQHKDDHMKSRQDLMGQTGLNKRYNNIELINSQFNYKNNILNNETTKDYGERKESYNRDNELFNNSTNLNMEQTQSKITISKLRKNKMFDYFENEIILNSIYCNKKLAIFIDNFNNVKIINFPQKSSPQTYDYDTKIYPKINHSNISVIDTYKNLVDQNYHYLLMIFFGAFIGKLIQNKDEINPKSIYISNIIAIESAKKILEVYKNSLELPTNPKFYLVNVSNDQINNYFNLKNMKQKENKFKLDCVNKQCSEYKLYNSLFDENLYPFFNSFINRKLLKDKGFINKDGFIMYDSEYRSAYCPEQMNSFIDPTTKNSLLKTINKINVGGNINNKELDVLEVLLKKTQPINKKLPVLPKNFLSSGYTKKFIAYGNVIDQSKKNNTHKNNEKRQRIQSTDNTYNNFYSNTNLHKKKTLTKSRSTINAKPKKMNN